MVNVASLWNKDILHADTKIKAAILKNNLTSVFIEEYEKALREKDVTINTINHIIHGWSLKTYDFH